MQPGTESFAILFVLVLATLLTYWISGFNLATLFPGITALGAFVILWNFSKIEPINLKEGKCPSCGHWRPETARFCQNCGKWLS